MPIPAVDEPRVALQAVGVDRRARLDVTFREVVERRRLEIGNDLHANAPGGTPSFFDAHEHERRLAAPKLAAPSQPRLRSSDPSVVEFDVTSQRLPGPIHHRTPELVKNHPRCLVALDSEVPP